MMSDERPPPELSPAMVRDQLLRSCAAHYQDTELDDEAAADRRRIRDGLFAAQAAIESVETAGALGSYVHRLIVALEHERAQFLAFDNDDPDHWRAGAVRTILRELEHTAGWLLPTARSHSTGTLLVVQDLVTLIDRQLPLLRELHSIGSLAPVASTMDANGEVTGEAFTTDAAADVPVENTLDRFARQFARTFLAEEPIKAAAIFFHGQATESTVLAAHTIEEANALVGWLQHQSGQSVQAVIRYSLEPAAEGSPPRWKYEAPIFSEVAAFPTE